MDDRQKRWLLGGLLLCWVSLILWQTIGGPESQQTSLRHRTGQVTGQTAADIRSLTIQSNRLDDSRTTKLAFGTPKNIFAPIGQRGTDTHSIPPKTQEMPRPAPEPPASPSAPSGPSPEELAARKARQKLAQYTYLGFLTQNGEAQAFLKKGSSIYIVKAGEALEPDVSLADLDHDAVILSAKTGINGATITQTITLSKE